MTSAGEPSRYFAPEVFYGENDFSSRKPKYRREKWKALSYINEPYQLAFSRCDIEKMRWQRRRNPNAFRPMKPGASPCYGNAPANLIFPAFRSRISFRRNEISSGIIYISMHIISFSHRSSRLQSTWYYHTDILIIIFILMRHAFTWYRCWRISLMRNILSTC